MYKHLVKPIYLFLSPQVTHGMFVRWMKRFEKHRILGALVRSGRRKEFPGLERELFGLTFAHPLGVAAGIDVNGEIYNSLGSMGFSFVEIGSITPERQNLPMTIRRNVRERSIQHPTYSNNKGVRNVIRNIQNNPPQVIIAANLAPQATNTKDEETIKDYQTSFSLLFDFVDMFVINVSCTNKDGLDPVQELSDFKDIIDPLLELRLCYGSEKPILVKLSPDTPHSHLDSILDYCMYSGIDGVVAGNATKENGGMSGAPVFPKALDLVTYIHNHTRGRLPVIGCGGISSPKQAEMMLEAGASLIQINSALSFEGPSFIRKVLKYISRPR